jgi:hypothetical protein
MAVAMDAPPLRGRKEERKEVHSEFRKEGRMIAYQLCLIRTVEPTETEKFIFLLWDGLKHRSTTRFLDGLHALSAWLSDEQFDETINEVKRFLTLDDKAWLLSVLSSGVMNPLMLIFPTDVERKAMVTGNKGMNCILVLFISSWDYYMGGGHNG